jgi:hypothetical protein
MKRRVLLGSVMAWAAGSALASGACGGAASYVTDFGLHRQWIVERNLSHPERPATLVEVPWSAAAAQDQTCNARPAPPASLSRHAPLPPLSAAEVRAGMRVSVYRRDGEAEIHLAGVALESGWAGDKVAVETGWHGLVLHGVVRGPALVELLVESGGKP